MLAFTPYCPWVTQDLQMNETPSGSDSFLGRLVDFNFVSLRTVSTPFRTANKMIPGVFNI